MGGDRGGQSRCADMGSGRRAMHLPTAAPGCHFALWMVRVPVPPPKFNPVSFHATPTAELRGD